MPLDSFWRSGLQFWGTIWIVQNVHSYLRETNDASYCKRWKTGLKASVCQSHRQARTSCHPDIRIWMWKKQSTLLHCYVGWQAMSTDFLELWKNCKSRLPKCENYHLNQYTPTPSFSSSLMITLLHSMQYFSSSVFTIHPGSVVRSSLCILRPVAFNSQKTGALRHFSRYERTHERLPCSIRSTLADAMWHFWKLWTTGIT